jgi:CBS domain-containing protein
MLVRQILNSKGGEVITISPNATLAEAVDMLAARRIGAVVVSADGATARGILSERDVMRELGTRGTACLSDPVDKVMTRAVYSCAPDDSADRVLETMTARRFRHMPVLEAGKMIGIISIGDVVAARLSELELERSALTGMIMGH